MRQGPRRQERVSGTTDFEIVVVGGGHAGIEAALAAARLGARTLLVTHDRREIGRMPCNPAIGGIGKGHLVREIDVLGGQMGLAIDAAGIQFRILNRRKGPAVRAPRAQADKAAYQRHMLAAVEAQPGLELLEDEVVGLLADGSDGPRLTGVRVARAGAISCRRAVLATGTFLRGLMHVGARRERGGREGASSAEKLSGDLRHRGFELHRLKTGTPPRLWHSGIDFAALAAQPGDDDPRPFSFRTRDFAPPQVPCHLAHTGPRTHAAIRANLHRSPLYSGTIEGLGPRYCPSIEDKVVRFPGRDRHLLFLEPEGPDSEEIYVNGLSTSLPADVQLEIVRSIAGLEEADIARYGYAVEYDAAPSWQVRPSLEARPLAGLFLAGQILGTSGYEEAAAQGIMAGVNAYLSLHGQSPFILARNEAYIGVMIDDLVTKQIAEPYRIFTSRAEHRLALRCDNAETRLLPHAARLGLLGASDLALLGARVGAAARAAACLGGPGSSRRAPPAEATPEGTGPAAERLRRGEGLGDLLAEAGQDALRAALASATGGLPAHLGAEALTEAENTIRYEGYIARQERLLLRQRLLDSFPMPEDFDYAAVTALSWEAREKLQRMRPESLGQASRIDGVRAGDLAVLSVMLRRASAAGRSAEAASERPEPAPGHRSPAGGTAP